MMIGGAGASPPDAPTIGTATGGNASASVTFSAPANNGGSAITGFTVTSSPSGITGTGASSPITVSGLSNGTAYTFTVTATNASGTSSPSAASNSITTPVAFTPEGAYDSLATVTVPSGGVASITFAGIPITYKHLQIRTISRNTAGANGYYAQFRVGNGSVDSGSNYAGHYLAGNGAGTAAGAYTTQTYGRLFGNVGGPTSNNTGFGAVADFLDYSNTNKYKTMRILQGADDNGSGEIGLNSALWQSTSAINTITIYAFSQGSASTFAEYSSFALYGCK
jgi:hypothetical protein